jgi:hypothetical protein
MLACLAELEQLSEKTDAHSGRITSVAFSPDGTKIVSGSWDKTIKVWESGALLANAAGALRTLALGDPAIRVAIRTLADGDAAIRAAMAEAGLWRACA